MAEHQKHGAHHVVPTTVYYGIFAILLILTGVTVAAAYIDLGRFNTVHTETAFYKKVDGVTASVFMDSTQTTGEKLIYWLTFPTEANYYEGKISILAPVGTAMLGYRRGDVIEWKVPSGVRRLKVEEVLYQPESKGDYHL